eukprot:CAMPEP_0183830538 /NCGR_PEP_ID=MMETSP0807_2-20130328/4077_1 /TAXON_ID=88271 /ORGANISM="Picocystis salinarum, Strain CCMP1897" /LENGTH=401 /DNA_ID=CAMNT_0026075911 /DNA_START=14 /DNA_END=1219 /DNA_ORIENTATION=-
MATMDARAALRRCVRSNVRACNSTACEAKVHVQMDGLGKCRRSLVPCRTKEANLVWERRSVHSHAARNAKTEDEVDDGKVGCTSDVLEAVGVLRNSTRKERKTFLVQSRTWEREREAIMKTIVERRDETSKEETGENEYEILRRSLKTLEKEIQRQKELLRTFLETHSTMWESLVVQHRTELNENFFRFLTDVQDSSIDREVQDGMATLYTKLFTLCEIHDAVTKDEQIMATASQEFTDVLNVESLGEAEAKIDKMASEGRLSPAFMLTMAKAWAGAKESDMTRDEVKDVLAHLYFRARDNMARQQPKEARILKYLLTLEDKVELRTRLTEAFTEAPEYETSTEDYLCTTPDKLLKIVDAVLQAYKTQGKSPMIKDASGLMRPDTIKKIEELRAIIMSDYF